MMTQNNSAGNEEVIKGSNKSQIRDQTDIN